MSNQPKKSIDYSAPLYCIACIFFTIGNYIHCFFLYRSLLDRSNPIFVIFFLFWILMLHKALSYNRILSNETI